MTYNQGVKLLKKWLVPLALVSIVVIGSWALCKPGIFRVHDFTQAGRVAEMARGLQDGQMPVRWSQNFGYGYGMPLFVFYAPLPYYVGAILWIVGVPMILVLKVLLITPTIITVVALYFLARRWLPVGGALLAAAAVSAAPYRAVNLFIRGAVSEMTGMAFFTVTLLGLAMTYDKKRWGWLVLILGLAGTVLSHNLTMVLSVIPLTGFMAVLIAEDFLTSPKKIKKWWQERWQTLGVIFGSGILAVGLSAFYWLPALTLKGASQLDTYILADYFNFRLHFLYIRQFFMDFWRFGGSTWGPNDDITYFLGWGQLAGIAISGVIGTYYLFIKKKTTWLVGFALGVTALLCLALTLQRSQPIWELFPFLAYIQFPWRFISVALPLLALFSAWWTSANIPRGIKIGLYSICFALLAFNTRQFVPETWLDDPEAMYSVDPTKMRGELSRTLVDYIPVGFTEPLPWNDFPYRPAGTIKCLFDECAIETLVMKDSKILLKVTTQSETDAVVVARSYFPGWEAEINGEPAEVRIGENANMFVQIPKGESTVGLQFGRSPEMMWGDILTLASLLLLLGFIVRTGSGHEKK